MEVTIKMETEFRGVSASQPDHIVKKRIFLEETKRMAKFLS